MTKYLSPKHGNLNSDPQHPHKDLAVMIHVYSPSTRNGEIGESQPAVLAQ